MDTVNYKKRELTIDAVKANIYALAFALPFMLVMIAVYVWVWHSYYTFDGIMYALKNSRQLLLLSPLVFLTVFLGGVLVHEFIHGITWAVFCKRGFASIRFGIIWKAVTPYCHCKEPLKAWQYLVGGLMPAILMGFVPAIWGIVAHNIWLFAFGVFFTMAAGGDFLVAWMLRNESADTLVQDHPKLIGCIVYEEPSC